MTRAPVSGLLVLDKPSGPTSHDCVARLRHVLGEAHIGHAGTLDPLAQGVLLLLIGKATNFQERFMKFDKEYWFRAEFGCRSVSGDRDGLPMVASPYRSITISRLRDLLKSFEGDQWQLPPRYAAVKHRGRPLYQWARRGIEVPREPRLIHVSRCELLRFDEPFFEGRIICSKGTYVRSLIEDIADQIGTSAVLDGLIRERVGPYHRSEASSLEQIVEKATAGCLQFLNV